MLQMLASRVAHAAIRVVEHDNVLACHRQDLAFDAHHAGDPDDDVGVGRVINNGDAGVHANAVDRVAELAMLVLVPVVPQERFDHVAAGFVMPPRLRLRNVVRQHDVVGPAHAVRHPAAFVLVDGGGHCGIGCGRRRGWWDLRVKANRQRRGTLDASGVRRKEHQLLHWLQPVLLEGIAEGFPLVDNGRWSHIFAQEKAVVINEVVNICGKPLTPAFVHLPVAAVVALHLRKADGTTRPEQLHGRSAAHDTTILPVLQHTPTPTVLQSQTTLKTSRGHTLSPYLRAKHTNNVRHALAVPCNMNDGHCRQHLRVVQVVDDRLYVSVEREVTAGVLAPSVKLIHQPRQEE
eukprot:m.810454 g.810454  ORF g.810454 m.810454 type:complete len:348 (-) comp23387_c0_seq4:1066-2109(-)